MLAHAYEYVCAIAKYQNITKAAEFLCITQPALTKYINRLEADLGVKLFDRSSNPITLTPAGTLFAEKAEGILQMEQQLLSELNLLTNVPNGKVNLGVTPEFCGHILPFVLPYFKKKYPNIQLHFTEGSSAFLLNELEKGRLDLCISTHSPKPGSDISIQPLLQDTILLAVPQSFAVARQFDPTGNAPTRPYYLPPSAIIGGDFIVCSPNIGMGETAQRYFDRFHLEPHIVMTVSRHENALRLASSGLGMAFTPASTPLRLNLIKPMLFFSLDDPLALRTRYICYPRHGTNQNLVDFLIPIICELFDKTPELKAPQCQLVHASGEELLS